MVRYEFFEFRYIEMMEMWISQFVELGSVRQALIDLFLPHLHLGFSTSEAEGIHTNRFCDHDDSGCGSRNISEKLIMKLATANVVPLCHMRQNPCANGFMMGN